MALWRYAPSVAVVAALPWGYSLEDRSRRSIP
jgi:hypothetical protein